MSYIEDEPPSVLLPCAICSRTFRPEVLERHIKVCEKTASKKRRVFDSFKNRVSGTELEEFLGPTPLPGQPLKKPCKSPVKKRGHPKWKETHENLIAVLRAARGVGPAPDTVLEAPKHAGNEQCPSCNRFFGPRAFDRHVEFCKEKTARIKMTPSKVSQAQERLEARTKYRAPLSIKPKLTTKEKYSPMLPRKELTESCIVSTSSTKTSPPISALSKNSKSVKQTSSSFSRQSPIRSSERQRSVSPMKKSLVSSSKSSMKSEALVKSSNQPKIKENLKGPEDLRPKTGTKLTTQDKIRSSSLKLSQLEDETRKQLSKSKRKLRENVTTKWYYTSDDESIETVESEYGEKVAKQHEMTRSKWSSLESINRTVIKSAKKEKIIQVKSGEEKQILAVKENEVDKSKQNTRDSKSEKKNNRQQTAVINDLSVNDESFGIFVAACSLRPPSSKASRTRLKMPKESPVKSTYVKEAKISQGMERTGRPSSTKRVAEVEFDALPRKVNSGTSSQIAQESQIKKLEKNCTSKIPKAKIDIKLFITKVEKLNPVQIVSQTEPEVVTDRKNLNDFEKSAKENAPEQATAMIKSTAKKWRNISEMSTEDLAQISEDLNVAGYDPSKELSESVIWKIAAEQFLKSGDSVQSSSVISLDSLNENGIQKNVDTLVPDNNCPNGDDFIVLHVTDPAKLLENDADMKLSISEPCFPCSDTVQKPKNNPNKSVKMDIVVFTALPNKLQTKIFYRKRKRKPRKPKKPKLIPNLFREKTFLANDFPKTKRRKLGESETTLPRCIDLSEYFFETSSKEELDERKQKFIQGLKSQREKIKNWQITANSHIKFMEEFQESIEDDLKELKNISKGKKTRRKSSFKNEKTKDMKKAEEKTKNLFDQDTTKEYKPTVKKYEYFEINLENDVKIENEESVENKFVNENNLLIKSVDVEKESLESREKTKLERPKLIMEDTALKDFQNQKTVKKFECFEIPKDDLVKNSKQGKNEQKENLICEEKLLETRTILNKDGVSSISDKLNNSQKVFAFKNNESSSEYLKDEVKELESDQDLFAADSIQTITYQNSSLENIEEVDEEEETNLEESKNIEFEDFILSKPNPEKILSKDGSCLDQLFPKPREITEIMTSAESPTAVPLDFTADSVYDLKCKEEKKVNGLPQIPIRSNSSRILQMRMKMGSQLPQILVQEKENKENSMISLIGLWKNKRDSLESEKLYKMKATLPSVKLAPLSNDRLLQIAVLPVVLKQKLSEIVNARLLDGGDGNDSYDPFKQAERQMLALLSWPSTVDIKSANDLSPKPKPNSQQKLNLETSPTSAFTKYPNKDNKSAKNEKPVTKARKNLNETFEVNETAKKNIKNEKPTYTAADDWEEIFEKHFDLNRNEMPEPMARSAKSALDGLVKNSLKNNSNLTDSLPSPQKNKSDFTENSVITEVLYTSTPKQNSKSDKTPKSRSKDNPVDLDRTPNTYRKSSNFSYGRITPPVDFTDSYEKGKVDEKPNRNSGVSLSSLSFCSQISDTTLADEEVMRSNLEIIGKAAAAAAAKTPRRKYARSQSVFDERNKMLFAKTYDPNFSSSDENDVEVLPKIVDKQGKKSPSRNSYPKSVPSHFSRSQSVMNDRCKGDGDHSDDADHVSSPDNIRNRKAKLSGDSAYSSLNRRSPRQNTDQNQHEDRLSSSGSEHSLPAVNNDFDLKLKSLDLDKATARKDQPVKMSKFCHECGSKYPVAVAKFCCECGVRRLII